jgi:hypothetical protein
VSAADFSAEALARAAGVDPWTLARKVTTADHDMLGSTATAYAAKAEDAAMVARAGRDADRAAAAAFTNNGAPVYDADSSARTARTLLSADGEDLRRTGAVYAALARDLTGAQSAVTGSLQTLTADLNGIVGRRNLDVTKPGLTSTAVEEIDRGYASEAAARVRETGDRMQQMLDAYDGQIRGHTATLAAMPQARPVAPITAAPAAATGPLNAAGALIGQVVDAGASLLNAMAHHPAEMLALAGGAALVALSSIGEAAGVAADSTVVGLPVGLGLGAVSTLGVGAGAAMIVAATGVIVSAAVGEDKVTGVIDNPFGDVFTAPTMIDSRNNPWDRNGTWETVESAIPKGEDIRHSPSSRVHLPYGSELPDGSWSGGHWNESGVANKNVFPRGWSPERILDVTEDVARNPDQVPHQTERGTWEVVGTRDGVEITVILKPDGEIITGHPERGPGVERNDKNGDPRPLPEN